MKLEEALPHLRDFKKIYRKDRKQKDGYYKVALDDKGNIEFVYGSYYSTVFDLLADDWEVE